MRIPRSLTALALFLAGCTVGGIANDPITRSFQWPDVMAGNDIRRDCGPGSPERWRFVYNGIYSEQVRVYEIEGSALDVRVFDRLALGFFDSSAADRFLHGARAHADLDREDRERLARAWESDMTKAAKPGDYVRSDRFFWTAALCRDGRFSVAAFPYPADGTQPFDFPALLARFDRTDRPTNPPRPVARDAGTRADFAPSRHSGDTGIRFLLTVTPDGLRPEY